MLKDNSTLNRNVVLAILGCSKKQSSSDSMNEAMKIMIIVHYSTLFLQNAILNRVHAPELLKLIVKLQKSFYALG